MGRHSRARRQREAEQRSAEEAAAKRRKQRGFGWAGFLVAAALVVIEFLPRIADRETPVFGHRVVRTYPHDSRAYCQGLLFADGNLFESTGRNGTSSVRRVDLATGKVLARVDLPYSLFGEGLALHGESLIQLTWRAGRALVFDRQTLKLTRELRYNGEGWGLASDGRQLVQSNGTATLVFRDPETFRELRRVEVRDGDELVTSLNELEYVDGELFANIWKSDRVARIDPETGRVVGWIDFTGLFNYRTIPDTDAVLNGIAYDAEGERLFVTGKLWPTLFEVEIKRR